MANDETTKQPHDLRSDTSNEGVTLIVRQGNRYGTAGAGEHVIVDKAELQNRSTMTACMTLEDFDALLKKKAEKKAEPKVPPIKAIVDEGLARLQKQAEERERKKQELEKSAPPAAVDPLEAKAAAAAAKKQKKQQ